MACPLHISCGLWPFPQDKPVSNQDFRPTLCYLKFVPAWLLHTSNPCLIYPPGDQYAIAFAGPRAARPGARQAPPRPPGRSAGGAAAFWGRGQRPRPQNMPAAGLARQRAGGRSPPAAAPPPLRFPPTPKRQRKAWPHALWGRALKPRQEGSRQRFRPLGQSRCPCPTGSGGFIRPTAGYRRRPTPSASARRPPCA